MKLPSKHPKLVYASLIVFGLLLGGPAYALATSPGPNHSRGEANTLSAALVTGESTGGGCRMGYDTQTSTLTPPDDSTADNAPAASVTISKPCPGAVIGNFVSEVSTTTAGAFIHLDMRATCVATGGFSAPCTVGQQVFASPGHTFFQNVQAGVSTKAALMVWSGLPRGVWKFEVLPGGGASANLQFRTFVVEAYSRG
jgi:hypothetical protein